MCKWTDHQSLHFSCSLMHSSIPEAQHCVASQQEVCGFDSQLKFVLSLRSPLQFPSTAWRRAHQVAVCRCGCDCGRSIVSLHVIMNVAPPPPLARWDRVRHPARLEAATESGTLLRKENLWQYLEKRICVRTTVCISLLESASEMDIGKRSRRGSNSSSS